MIFDFSITSMEADFRNKCIKVLFTLEIDENTLRPSSATVFAKDAKNAENVNFEVCGKVLYLRFLTEPKVNTTYLVNITKDVRAISGQSLTGGLYREIVFESAVSSRAVFLKPCDDECVRELRFVLREEAAAESAPLRTFYLEVASDPLFHQVVLTALLTDREEISFGKELDGGQYFARARVQKETAYGIWSQTVSFIYRDWIASDEPVYEQELDVVQLPGDGCAGEMFILKFSEELASDSLRGQISVWRGGLE